MPTQTGVDVGQLAVYRVRADIVNGSEWIQHVRHNNSFVPAEYDEIVLGYTGSDLTSVIYKLRAATVGTLTLTYSGSNLTGVVRS